MSTATTEGRVLTVVQAMREGLREELKRDPEVFVMGEDIRIGGSFLFTLGMLQEFGPDRILNTPISEAGFVGLGIGAAMQGMRPVIDFQYGDFLFCAADQVIQQAAKLRYMSGGQVKVPLVLHLPTGASGRGAQHANSMEGFFFGVPGIKLVTPATPRDAKGLLKSAIRDDNPVIFCVHKHLYGSKGRKVASSQLSSQYVPEEEYTIPLGVADIKRAGEDVTVVANLAMLHHALNAAEALDAEGIHAEVIDPRTLVPFDYETVFRSVVKTGRLLVVEESPQRGGWGGHVATVISSRAGVPWRAPLRRLATLDVPIPFSPVLEAAVVPGQAEIENALRELVRR